MEAKEVKNEATKDAVKDKVEEFKKSKKKRTKSMGKLYEWPSHFRIRHLPIIKAGGRLLVEVVDDRWLANIQVSESIALQEYELLLKEHQPGASHTLRIAKEIFDTLKPKDAKKVAEFERDHANLKSLLQMIVNYIQLGQVFSGKPRPAKSAFWLMSRTSFYSMYHTILSKEERTLFKKLVKAKTIPTKLRLKNSDPVFKKGHGVVAAKNSPKIGPWLVSIYKGGGSHPDRPGGKTDIMSKPERGSAAMGRFDVDTRKGKKHSGLVRIEVRDTKAHGGNDRYRDDWVKFARDVFASAFSKRSKRPGIRKSDVEKTQLLDE